MERKIYKGGFMNWYEWLLAGWTLGFAILVYWIGDYLNKIIKTPKHRIFASDEANTIFYFLSSYMVWPFVIIFHAGLSFKNWLFVKKERRPK